LELVPAGSEPPPELLFPAGQAAWFVGRTGDELSRAVDAFEERGDLERAAEAAVAESWHKWHASGSEAQVWLDRAAALVEGRPSSRAKAIVVAEQARRAMLAYRYTTAIELADEAVALARDVGNVQIEADALVTGGGTRASMGQYEGIAMLEHGLELVGYRGRVASRGYTNLGVAKATFGDLQGAKETFELGLKRAVREGEQQGAWFIRGNLIGGRHSNGDWDGALELVDEYLGEAGTFRYQDSVAHGVRASILEARGEPAAAAAENDVAVRLARDIDEAQVIWPALTVSAWLARRHGRTDEAAALLDEVVHAVAASQSVGDPQEWQIALATELTLVDRDEEAHEMAARLPEGTRWRDATVATAERRYGDAADVMEAMGEQVIQADLRLLDARALVARGRLAEADAQLERARAFWRSVGAVALLREAEGVIAEAG
jgi:tetratricopeptide (TPR) repeat protein